ncbi:hypothetical protein GQ54DRAFT_79689 [Martensiomyces pterosporus]|nr:hypothetical protein GQ54DRAFT_79689 [Martensiomyces pterosporus]
MPVAELRLPSERVLDSAHFISQHSHDVRVPEAGVRKAAQGIMDRMKTTGYSTAEWKKNTLTPSVADDAAIEWIFVVDALNFSFWSDKGGSPEKQYTVSLDGHAYKGYWTLCAAINRAIREGVKMTDAQFYSKVERKELAYVFRTDDPQTQESIPMLDQRMEVLHEVGGVLVERYGGRFANLLKECQGSAQKLVERVVREFPCFRDVHRFEGQTAYIYKRAQILVADIWACFEGKGSGRFDDIDAITMFADYRVPQALCHFGALEYSPRLLEFLSRSEQAVRQKLESGVQASPPTPGLLPSGHPWELEIRGNSIWAVERIRQAIVSKGVHVNAILLDFYIWDYAKENSEAMKDIPIHLTRSIFY